MKKFDKLKKEMSMEIREHKSTFIVYVVLRALVVLCLVLQVLKHNYENVFLCILTLFLFMMPSFLQVNLQIELPSTLEIIILLFIFAAEILGEIQAYYVKIPEWDMILHTLNGFLMAAIGFSLVDILNREERLKFELSPAFMSVVAFCFSMTVGVIWEFFEFSMDRLFGLDMQKDTILHGISSVMLDPTGGNTPVIINNIKNVMINGKDLGLGGYLDIGLFDTMKDLWVNFLGALVFSIIGFFYIKHKGQGRVANRFIPKLKQKMKVDDHHISHDKEKNDDDNTIED